MNTSEQLAAGLEQVMHGEPWYGLPVYTLLDRVTFEIAYERPAGAVHNIAAIVLHMLSWTEEVMDRLNGLSAQLPSSGDWPDPGTPDERKWQVYVEDLKLVTVNLLGLIGNLSEEKWNEPMRDDNDHEHGKDIRFIDLVKGLIQHNIYHSAQIALLTRQLT